LALGALLLWQPLYALACALGDGAQAYQPSLTEARQALELAARNQLGSGYPAAPQLEVGYPQSTPVTANGPCTILKALAWVEGAWQQANPNVVEGSTGPVKQSATCGYGVMQITSGMRQPGELPPDVQQQIAADYRYNIAWGAKTLAEKWNAGDNLNAVVGNRDPGVGEHWYYAAWAYNQFTFKNNPNNPDYAANRPAYDGSQNRTLYPYQEVIWGTVAHPPVRNGAALWSAVPLNLPDPALIGQTPGPIPAPPVTHAVACPAASVSPTAVRWTVVPGAGAQTAKVQLTGSSNATKWSAVVSGESWLTVTPFSGTTLPAELTLTAQPGGLKPGSYSATVNFSVEGSTVDLKVTAELVVKPEARLSFPIVPKRSIIPR
jgi:hypothetical protein